MNRPSICCDTCPYSPTCEEEAEFYDQVFGAGDFEWGEEYPDEVLP